VVSGHIIINNKYKHPALIFAFRSIRTCRELRTWRRFWERENFGLGPQTTPPSKVSANRAPQTRGVRSRSARRTRRASRRLVLKFKAQGPEGPGRHPKKLP
jgi:hypothetical protein